MRRRDSMGLLGGGGAGPLAARGQKPESTRRVGVLMGTTADDPEGQARHDVLLQGLQESGWGVGRNARIDYRWAGGDAERIRKYAAELVALTPDVILTTGTPATAALQQLTRSVPIIFVQ